LNEGQFFEADTSTPGAWYYNPEPEVRQEDEDEDYDDDYEDDEE
jgi:hypothetical protein